jgi:hypothetical protein
MYFEGNDPLPIKRTGSYSAMNRDDLYRLPGEMDVILSES